MREFLFLIGGIAAALAAAFLYITLAANAEANHQDRVMSVPQIVPDLDAFLRSLHGAAGDRVIEGNAVEVFQNGDDAARKQYPLALNENADLNQFLKTIEQTMKARGT